jgi:curved DNA-binding protein CbpA
MKNFETISQTAQAYNILGVGRGVGNVELKAAYRKLAKQNHPDLFQNPKDKQDAEEKIKQINSAYEKVKLDVEKRESAQQRADKMYQNYKQKNSQTHPAGPQSQSTEARPSNNDSDIQRLKELQWFRENMKRFVQENISVEITTILQLEQYDWYIQTILQWNQEQFSFSNPIKNARFVQSYAQNYTDSVNTFSTNEELKNIQGQLENFSKQARQNLRDAKEIENQIMRQWVSCFGRSQLNYSFKQKFPNPKVFYQALQSSTNQSALIQQYEQAVINRQFELLVHEFASSQKLTEEYLQDLLKYVNSHPNDPFSLVWKDVSRYISKNNIASLNANQRTFIADQKTLKLPDVGRFSWFKNRGR